MRVDGEPMSASLFDFGLSFPQRPSCSPAASAPTSTCPRWRATSRPRCGTTCSASPRTRSAIPRGTIRATVLIETIPAAFEMDEILYELREHATGLNAGRWDYLFSFIKKFRERPGVRAPRPRAGDDDRPVHAGVHRASGPDLPPPRRTRDGRHGGVHPVRRTPRSTRSPSPRCARTSARVGDGFDGTWVAHPDLVPVAREVSTRCSVTAAPEGPAARGRLSVRSRPARRRVPGGRSPSAGVRDNVDVGLQYLTPGSREPVRRRSTT